MTTKAQPAEMEKHEVLVQAIETIESVAEHAKQLRDKITGEGSGTAKEEGPRANYSLATVLSQGPNSIRNACDETHKILKEIKQIIF